MLVAEVEIVAVREMADRDSNKVSHKDFSGSDHGNEQLLEFSTVRYAMKLTKNRI